MSGTAQQKEKGITAMTVRLPDAFAQRLRLKLAQDCTKFQTLALALLTEYVDGKPVELSEHERRMKIAKEELERFRGTFEILAR